MFYLVSGTIFFILQLFLVVTTRINIFPELFFFPWLVSKGLLPYRDFFDNHGFLLAYVLAPLTSDRSLLLIKLFFIAVQLLNLILVLILLKRASNKIGFIIGGVLFVLLNFFMLDNNVWYEVFITSFYLLIFLLAYKKSRRTNIVSGILVGLVSLIKPTAAIILPPVLYMTKSITPIVSFLGLWLLALLFFLFKGGFTQLIDNLFLYNSYAQKNYHSPYFSDEKLLLVSMTIITICIVLNIIYRKTKTIIPIVLFLFSGLIFVFYEYARFHLVPTAAFFVILISKTIKNAHGFLKSLFIGIVIIYLIFLGQKIKSQYYYLKTQTPWIENSANREIISYLKNQHYTNRNIYVIGNRAEFYYFLNQLPKTYFPLWFPVLDIYVKGFENSIISDLERNNIQVIIISPTTQNMYEDMHMLNAYISNSYSIALKVSEYTILVRK